MIYLSGNFVIEFRYKTPLRSWSSAGSSNASPLPTRHCRWQGRRRRRRRRQRRGVTSIGSPSPTSASLKSSPRGTNGNKTAKAVIRRREIDPCEHSTIRATCASSLVRAGTIVSDQHPPLILFLIIILFLKYHHPLPFHHSLSHPPLPLLFLSSFPLPPSLPPPPSEPAAKRRKTDSASSTSLTSPDDDIFWRMNEDRFELLFRDRLLVKGGTFGMNESINLSIYQSI